MRVIEAETKAWLTDYADPERLNDEANKAINTLTFYNGDMTKSGWTLVGKAMIRVEIVDENELIANKVKSLRAEITKTRADAQMRETQLNDKINQLLAITCDVVAA